MPTPNNRGGNRWNGPAREHTPFGDWRPSHPGIADTHDNPWPLHSGVEPSHTVRHHYGDHIYEGTREGYGRISGLKVA